MGKAILRGGALLLLALAAGCDGGGSGGIFGGSWAFGLFTMEIDGSDVEALWKGEMAIAQVAPSPDGRRLAMVAFLVEPGEPPTLADLWAASAIAVMDLDAGDEGPRVVLDWPGTEALPAWSPDGTRILFASQGPEYRPGEEKVRTDLYTMDPDGGDIEQITDTPDVSEGDPHWAEGVILFIQPNPETGVSEIRSWNLDTGNRKRVTAPDLTVPEGYEGFWSLGDFDPHLSPDRTRIAFERHLDASWAGVGDFDVTVLDLAEGGAERVISLTNDADIRPVYAAGRWLAFYRLFSTMPDDLSDVIVVRDDGSGFTNLTEGFRAKNEQWPAWLTQPGEPVADGRPDLVFIAERGGP